MKTYNISVVRADGSYGYATISYSEASTVTVQVTGINSGGSNWRVRGRASLGDDNIYLEKQGLGTYTFNSDNNKSYIFQIQNWNGDWVNTSNMEEQVENSIFDVVFESGGGDSGGSGGSSDDPTTDHYYYLWVHQGEGTKVTITRSWTESSSEAEGSYFGVLNHDTESWYENVLWYGYKVWYLDFLYIDVEALDGYKLDTYVNDGMEFNYEVGNLVYNDANGNWGFYASGEPWIYTSATAMSTVRIYDAYDSAFNPYFCHIYNSDNDNWDMYVPYIYNQRNDNWDVYN